MMWKFFVTVNMATSCPTTTPGAMWTAARPVPQLDAFPPHLDAGCEPLNLRTRHIVMDRVTTGAAPRTLEGTGETAMGDATTINVAGYVATDSFFGTPYIDQDEERTAITPHRYLH